MYFFYLKETGTSDPKIIANKKNASKGTNEKDHLYVLTAISLHEFHWKTFEIEVSKIKFQLLSQLFRERKLALKLTDCEVKSTWMRIPRERKRKSEFLSALSDEDLARLSEAYYNEFERDRMKVFSVVIDKRHLKGDMSQQMLFEKAYGLMLDMIEGFMEEYYEKHQAMIVMESGAKSLFNASIETQANYKTRIHHFTTYKHIVEYPFIVDSRLSNGLQLADLCGYNIYRAFREEDFSYSFYQRIQPYIFKSHKTEETELDGLRVWPTESALKALANA